MMSPIEVTEVDFTDVEHTGHFMVLMKEYALDEMGIEEELPKRTRKCLVNELQNLSSATSFLAYLDSNPVGLVTGFISFSTFDARKVMNVHDLFVKRASRGKRIGDKLLQAIQKKSKQLKCGGLTIEVRDDNHSARKLYERFGFEDGDPVARFMTKDFV